MESLSTETPRNVGELHPPALNPGVLRDEQAQFFNIIWSFYNQNAQELKKFKSVDARSVNRVKWMLVAVFILKYKKGYDAGIPLREVKFSDEEMFRALDLQQLRDLDKFLCQCGLSKKDRVCVLTEFMGWKPGLSNGKVGKVLKDWNAGRIHGNKCWYVRGTEVSPTYPGGREIKIPWVGHLISLFCLFPRDTRFIADGALLQSKPQTNG